MMTTWLLMTALAAPPSSTLRGDEGTLTWTVTPSTDGVRIQGSSPKWTVDHTAKADFTPVRTTRTSAAGETVTVTYTPTGATVAFPDREVTVSRAGLWDGDTLDVRLGALSAKGETTQRFHALDPASGKVYEFDTQLVAAETCGASPCTHLLVQLTGLLRWVGPSFHYWYAPDGQLLRFEGPAGTFSTERAKP